MSNRSTAEASIGDTELLERARAGNADAIGRLLQGYESYFLLLVRLQLGAKLRGKVDPGDIVQETFLEAHRQFAQFRGTTEREVLAWLRRILAGQLALTMRRFLGTRGRDVRLERELATHLENSSAVLEKGLTSPVSSPSHAMKQREQSVILAEALNRIAIDYREVIILRHFESLSFAEAAGRMNRTVDSVEKLWVRALAKLRKEMSEPV